MMMIQLTLVCLLASLSFKVQAENSVSIGDDIDSLKSLIEDPLATEPFEFDITLEIVEKLEDFDAKSELDNESHLKDFLRSIKLIREQKDCSQDDLSERIKVIRQLMQNFPRFKNYINHFNLELLNECTIYPDPSSEVLVKVRNSLPQGTVFDSSSDNHDELTNFLKNVMGPILYSESEPVAVFNTLDDYKKAYLANFRSSSLGPCHEYVDRTKHISRFIHELELIDLKIGKLKGDSDTSYWYNLYQICQHIQRQDIQEKIFYDWNEAQFLNLLEDHNSDMIMPVITRSIITLLMDHGVKLSTACTNSLRLTESTADCDMSSLRSMEHYTKHSPNTNIRELNRVYMRVKVPICLIDYSSNLLKASETIEIDVGEFKRLDRLAEIIIGIEPEQNSRLVYRAKFDDILKSKSFEVSLMPFYYEGIKNSVSRVILREFEMSRNGEKKAKDELVPICQKITSNTELVANSNLLVELGKFETNSIHIQPEPLVWFKRTRLCMAILDMIS